MTLNAGRNPSAIILSVLVLIDGHSSLYRAYYAIRHLSARDGTPTNAVFGFVQILHKILDDFSPDHCGVAFDVARKTFRSDLYPPYKSTRKPMPDDLRPQVPLIKEILGAMTIPVLEMEDFEADDVIATLATQTADRGDHVLIVSSDKDLMQLLSNKIHLYHTSWGEVVTPASFEARMGFPSSCMTEYQALLGDSSDNIPGVRGIGEKGAQTLIQSYGTLEEIYSHLDEIKGATGRKLAEGRDQAFLSRDLATLRRDLPLSVEEDALALTRPDMDVLKELYLRLDFTSLARKLESSETRTIREVEGPPDWRGIDHAAIVKDGSEICLSLSPDILYSFSRDIWKTQANKGNISWITFHAKDLYGTVLHPRESGGVPIHDIELMAYLLDPGRAGLGITDLASRYLGRGEVHHIPPVILELYPILLHSLKEEGLFALYEEIELPLISILSAMEADGVYVDTGILYELGDRIAKQMGELEKEIYDLAGHPFNINSPKQLREILYEEMGLRPSGVKTAKTKQLSTGEQALQDLISRGHAFPALILKYRELAKLSGTYVEPIPKLLDSRGRLHTTFHQTTTATGRLSSSDPNVQNIPIRTELGREIRRAFAAPPGRLLVAADYSQIELRLLAHFSEDPVLLEAFRRGADIHTATAAKVFHISEEEVTPDLRRRAKTINFGVLYGMSAHGLSTQMGISREEAQDFITAYFEGFPGIRSYLDGVMEETRNTGLVRTLKGRLRRLPEIHSSNFNIRSNAERMAINAPLQGTAADIIKMAMVRVWRDILRDSQDVKMVLQVHDELLLEVPESIAGEIGKRVKSIMESVVTLHVPLQVDVGVGAHWEEVK